MRVAFVVLATCLSGCAAYGDVAANDPQALAYPWCADQARELASQPMPENATHEEREAMRNYHMSQECQKATERKVEVSFPAKRSP